MKVFLFSYGVYENACVRLHHNRTLLHNNLWNHRHTGPVSLGGGGGLWSLARIFSPKACPKPKIKWFCPNITCFLPEKGHLTNSRRAAALSPPPPTQPRTPMCGMTDMTNFKTRTTILPYSDERKQLLKIKFLVNEQNVSVIYIDINAIS